MNDRIYRVNDREFADAETLRKLVTEVDGPVSLEIERLGRVRTVEVPAVEAEIARFEAVILNRGTDSESK